MKAKYPVKKLVFVLDNLAAHKTSYIMKILQCEVRCFLLYTPTSSPELSPIENMFSLTKKQMAEKLPITDPELFALELSKIMFAF